MDYSLSHDRAKADGGVRQIGNPSKGQTSEDYHCGAIDAAG